MTFPEYRHFRAYIFVNVSTWTYIFLILHLVPTLCVGMQPGRSASCLLPNQHRLHPPGRRASLLHSHAERGNEI
ncbi:MAG: hypothetical protein GY749_29215 [Desulfobacteraceae bacterium]|nr:hypothetical protein [Desulfobacteraceae bacterium]